MNVYLCRLGQCNVKSYISGKVMSGILLLIFSLLHLSCGPRYITMEVKRRQMDKGKITLEQYTAVCQRWYRINSNNFVSSDKVKKQGAYVYIDYNNFEHRKSYHIMKFADSLDVTFGYMIYDTLSNEAVAKGDRSRERYTANGKDKLAIEYLLTRDFNVHNIYQFAWISGNGDTVTIVRSSSKWVDDPEKGWNKKWMFGDEISSPINHVYIYHPDLTAIPGSKREKR